MHSTAENATYFASFKPITDSVDVIHQTERFTPHKFCFSFNFNPHFYSAQTKIRDSDTKNVYKLTEVEITLMEINHITKVKYWIEFNSLILLIA